MTDPLKTLAQMRAEVLVHGFDSTASARVAQYLTDAQNLVARRVDYYADEAAFAFSTITGTDTYTWPADLARVRELFNVTLAIGLQSVGLRNIDQSSVRRGEPAYYAIAGPGVRLYPVPDNVYSLELRYWKMPAPLLNDGDTSSLPIGWEPLLEKYAIAECYKAEDDLQAGQAWMQDFKESLAMFTADQKFPSTDSPAQARGMWDAEGSLSAPGGSWSLWGGW